MAKQSLWSIIYSLAFCGVLMAQVSPLSPPLPKAHPVPFGKLDGWYLVVSCDAISVHEHGPDESRDNPTGKIVVLGSPRAESWSTDRSGIDMYLNWSSQDFRQTEPTWITNDDGFRYMESAGSEMSLTCNPPRGVRPFPYSRPRSTEPKYSSTRPPLNLWGRCEDAKGQIVSALDSWTQRVTGTPILEYHESEERSSKVLWRINLKTAAAEQGLLIGCMTIATSMAVGSPKNKR